VANGLVFARVEVVVCEANEPLRRNIRDLLRQLGFGEIAAHEKPADCLPLLERGPVDLLICSDEGDDDAGFEMVHGIRHQAIDNNPFVVSISMINQQTGGKRAVAQAANSGTDMLIAKPFSSTAFSERIFSVANKRKPFVATASYIGPTRRKIPRTKREKEMEFKAPNPVKEIANGSSRDMVADRISKCASFLNKRKLRLNVEEIELRAGEVRDAMVKGSNGEDIGKSLELLRAATSDIQRRMAKNEVKHVLELCRLVLEVADRIDNENSGSVPRNLAAIAEIINGFKVALGNRGDGGG
jgi:DNA-binding response OmpR family regulator